MRDSYGYMVSVDAGSVKMDDVLSISIIVAVAVGSALTVFLACFFWFRHEQSRMKREILHTIMSAQHDPEGLILTGQDATMHGELIAQFKVNQGKQVVSVLESEGKRFIHVDGELSAKERAKMIHYLKSEGFVA